MREWTDEEKNNLMTYGKCPGCGEPRSVERTEIVDVTPSFAMHSSQRVSVSQRITCPNDCFDDC